MAIRSAISLGFALVLACATPVLADVVPNPSPFPSNLCGTLGGVTLSILLAIGGCWAVHNRRHRGS